MIHRLVLIAALLMPAVAAALEARVEELAGPEVVLVFDSAPEFRVGDTLELGYTAGFMEMLLGSYRVRETRGERLVLSLISSNNPPAKGMRVNVNRAVPFTLPMPAPAAAPTAAVGEGRVERVSGNSVELAFPPGTSVQVGDCFSLAFEAPRVGRVPIQGVWQVTHIDGGRAHAEAVGLVGQPRAGQVATPSQIPAKPEAGETASASYFPIAPEHSGGVGLFPNPPPGSFEEFLAGKPAQPIAPPAATPTAPSGGASWIGLGLQGLTPDLAQSLNLPAGMTGILVADVVEGGPAARAGLRPGDVVLDVDGRVLTPHQFSDQVRQSAPGTLLRVRIWRDGLRLFIAVRTAAKP